jgi:hypothetical protein
MLIGHLGGKAYSLRSSIVTALGHLVHKAFKQGPGEDADAQGMPLLLPQLSYYQQTCLRVAKEAMMADKILNAEPQQPVTPLLLKVRLLVRILACGLSAVQVSLFGCGLFVSLPF